MDIRASIVIPSCNRVDELRALIRSCLEQTVPVEIIIVDDAANDEVQRMTRVGFAGVRYFRMGKAKGPAFQRNRGIELATDSQTAHAILAGMFRGRETRRLRES